MENYGKSWYRLDGERNNAIAIGLFVVVAHFAVDSQIPFVTCVWLRRVRLLYESAMCLFIILRCVAFSFARGIFILFPMIYNRHVLSHWIYDWSLIFSSLLLHRLRFHETPIKSAFAQSRAHFFDRFNVSFRNRFTFCIFILNVYLRMLEIDFA